MTIQVLSEKRVPMRAIARQLGVTEGTVRYHLRRAADQAADGRKAQAFKAERFAAVIEAWRQAHQPSSRPINVRDLHDYLIAEHGYDGSYMSVLRYVRRRYGRPAKRTYRRVETPPGAQTQTDWGTHTDLDLGEGPQILQAFVMGLSHSRMPAIIWSHRQDQVSWLRCHNEAYRRLGGVAAVNRIDNVKTSLRLSGLPPGQTLDNFDWGFQPGIDRKRIETLATGSYIREHEGILFQGPPGIGKTHLAVALGVKAVENGFSVTFYRLEDLLHAMKQDEEVPPRRLRGKKYLKSALLIVDEVGFQPLTRQEASLFFRLVSYRYERSSTIITTNKSVKDWPEVLAGDEVMTTALLDRLLHRCQVFNVKGRSYRLRDLEGRLK